jgi:hypothetical protein
VAVDGTVTVDAPDRPGPPLRGASVLKPLYFWAAARLPGPARDPRQWAALAEPAVRRSANDPTVQIWDRCGADALLDTIAGLTGVRFTSDPTGRRTFGRVLVRAEEVARAYAALAAAAGTDADIAGRLLGWMREVPGEQTFGARTAAAAALGVPPGDVGVKCGWFTDEDETVLRTHAVTVTRLTDGQVRGTAVLTALPLAAAERTAYRTLYVEGPEVLPLHHDHAAASITAETSRLLA